ncbi:putative RNA-directed DNA polymerase from transposon X-element [Trichonephila clavipes]|nr:putative RNA-directed DNA polymerase from transposon X-element [Trichonephila clavipes]
MRMIERQLQTAVNNIVKWCDTNGHSISASKSCCVHFCRKRGIHPDPEIRIRDIQIPVVPDVRFLGVIFDRRLTFLPHILHLRKKQSYSRIDYGCVAYGSACNSTLQKLDPVHHMALRICSGAFRTSPVQSLYVYCHQLPLDLRRRKLSLAYYFKILSVPSHPLQNVYMSTSMKRLYDARPSNIRPFMDRMKLHISELDLPNVHIQQRNLFLFQPWNTPRFPLYQPFATYSKSTVAPVVFQRVFAYHRSQYSRYSAIYTDGSKRADYVGCGVVIEDIMHGYRLDTSCSIFTAEAVAIYRALQLIDSTMPRKYCIYTDSMSVLEALENYHDRCHPVVCTILDITSRLYSKGFDIVFCWLPSHVGIIGNEQADSAAKSATTHLPLAVPLSDMKRVIMHHIFKIWQESWCKQLDNKLHSVKPVIGAWPVMPMRRTDVKLTRLRIGHTRFTHRHLLFGERAPECWLKELEIDSFETLKDLIIADQIKKKCPPDYKNHFLDTWEILNDPVVLAEKLDSYENVKPSSQKLTKLSNSRFPRNTGNPEFRKSHPFKVEKNVSGNHNSAFANPSYMPARNTNTGFHPLGCYGCGNPGFIKSKCPKCSQKKESASVNAIHMLTCLTSPVALLDIEVYEATGTVCADTGASQSLGGELMFKFLRNRGQKFSEFHLAMCLADGQQSTSLVQKATVPITVGGRTFQIYLIFLPHAKGNRTLLGVDFLRTSGIVMDMRNNFWYFGDKPSFRIPFSKDVPLPVDDSPVEINSSSCPTNLIPSEIPLHRNTVDETETNDLHLREEEGPKCRRKK